MLAYVKDNNVQSAAVIGGGLLGLEAAKAVADMNVKSHIIEFAPILMCRQVRIHAVVDLLPVFPPSSVIGSVLTNIRR
jgi:NAD(P)H-nitrite reductase large subunit